MDIRLDDLTCLKVIELIREHLRGMELTSPPESIHALGVESLRNPDVTFWSAWEGDDVVGCGALKELDGQYGEIKSMRTASSHLRKGVAKRILQHIIEEARRRGYRRLNLETGSQGAFEPARKLYSNFGFKFCDPFSDYSADPNSVFMTLEL